MFRRARADGANKKRKFRRVKMRISLETEPNARPPSEQLRRGSFDLLMSAGEAPCA